jgi:adenine-specific DNA-methyltransferase
MHVARVREFRREMTDAERRLWAGLRDRRLNGLKFRRQRQIGPYFVDFVCLEAKLIVEADGSQHYEEDRAWYDYRRTKHLEADGYKVLRFTNFEVLKHPAGVLARIAEAARERLNS